ncbi:hypothetical protein V499_05856, partial [Pseudogymnoascus sp. VKM F-103]
MSLVNLANVCSHLQNASRARLGLTSVPASNMILGLSLSLQQSGFLRSVTRGGAQPPPVDALSTYVPEPVTQENVASRRLWLGLKYWNNTPVLSQMAMKPWITTTGYTSTHSSSAPTAAASTPPTTAATEATQDNKEATPANKEVTLAHKEVIPDPKAAEATPQASADTPLKATTPPP